MNKNFIINKRGSEDTLFFIIWELLAFAMVLIIIIVTVRGVVNNTTYWKNYYSRDLAMIADIANINQGDFVINYEIKNFSENSLTKIYLLSDNILEIALTPKAIEVYDYPKEKSKNPTIFPFAKHKNIKVIEETTTDKFLTLSKIGNELKLSNYFIESAKVCPSYSTSKDMTLTKFNVVIINNNVNNHAQSVKNILSRYGSSTNAKNELAMLFNYNKDNFIIYYSDDSNTLKSQKLACMLKEWYEKETNSTPEIKRYDGFLDYDSVFSKYISSKEPEEYFVIVQLSENEIKINQNDFAISTEKAILEYYK
ncbi:MAG: hypothetical protein KatS3mg002_0488 [Candidatus Woesearchaeota archaeon]|nr:MAG: hypothetical protein KatS3mg002_0488 [Candidatus Woesearchaeota archaeon]